MFRPCIDLHEGQVKQLVGGTLTGQDADLRTNYVSDHSAAWYAELYKRDGLKGGHIIMLGPGNENQALEALAAYPGGLQLGGGITSETARACLDWGASHVIMTSWMFERGQIHWARLEELVKRIGKQRLVIDLSCRVRDGDYVVVVNRWQTFTEVTLRPELFASLEPYCQEFLIHAVDKEGLASGVDFDLIEKLKDEATLPTTYAGGAHSLSDLEEVTRRTRGKIDLTIGSALDIFGGKGVRYAEAVAFNRKWERESPPLPLN